MKVLKYSLWAVLIFCLIWLGLIFFGPTLIKKGASQLSGGKINLTRVEVSPDLKISAAIVDFSSVSTGDEKNLSFFSRAVSIDWKIENGFEVFGDIGPSSSGAYGTLASATFSLQPISIFDWSEVNLQIKVKQLVGKSFEFKQADLSGKLTNSFQDFENIKVVVPEAWGELGGTTFEAKALLVHIDHFEADQSLVQQNSEIKYDLRQIKFPQSLIEADVIRGDIKFSNNDADFQISAANFQFPNQKITANSLTASSSRSLTAGLFEGAWEFSISEIESIAPAISVESYSGYLEFTPLGLSHSGRAVISRLDLKNDQYFIGQVEDAILDVVLTSSTNPSRIDLKAEGVLTLQEMDNFSAIVSIKSSLPNSYLKDCLNQRCFVEVLEAEYRVSASDAYLLGSLKCEMAGCFKRPDHLRLQTNNTNKFFQALSETGILNPISLPVAFMAISSGVVEGNGHLLNF